MKIQLLQSVRFGGETVLPGKIYNDEVEEIPSEILEIAESNPRRHLILHIIENKGNHSGVKANLSGLTATEGGRKAPIGATQGAEVLKKKAALKTRRRT